MRILYLEDDFVDQRLMKLKCSEDELTILDDFNLLETTDLSQYDLVISDVHIKMDKLNEHLSILTGVPLLILSNYPPSNFNFQFPVFSKPFQLELSGFLNSFRNQLYIQDQCSLEYVNEITERDPSEIHQMLKLLFDGFEETITELVKYIHKHQPNSFLNSLHKSINKFSMLGLSNLVDQAKSIEQHPDLLHDPANNIFNNLLAGLLLCRRYVHQNLSL